VKQQSIRPWVWIPVDRIQVLNPRSRTKAKFNEIVSNIKAVGLKKPIIASQRVDDEGEEYYAAGCGQGRIEAVRAMGHTEIPAFLVDATDEELLLTSLTENLARRHRSAVEQFWEIQDMKNRGYKNTEIALKTGLGVRHVCGILRLLQKGEQRLVQAVVRGQMPLTIAITIVREDDQATQRALTEAYEKKELRGERFMKVRQIIDQRRVRGRSVRTGRRTKAESELTSRDLMRAYEEETRRQRSEVRKARLCETQLVFVVSALKTLFEDDNFVTLLRAEKLDTLPEFLADRLKKENGES
jgi:ParB family chromosome partitioning protein